MDNLNDNLNEDFNGDLAENLNETRKQASGCLRRFSKSIKAVVIAFLILLLLIPMFMIEDRFRNAGEHRRMLLPKSVRSGVWRRQLQDLTSI